MDLSAYKELSIDGIALKSLSVNGIEIWRKGYTNWVPLSINADGTSYNGGLGYKNGYRIRSGGAEAVDDSTSCTGFIPVSAGDVVRVSGWDFWGDGNSSSGDSINVSDSSFTNLGQNASNSSYGYGIFTKGQPYYDEYGFYSVVEEKTGVWKWVVPPEESGVAYIRVCGNELYNPPGAEMIVTINEEIV